MLAGAAPGAPIPAACAAPFRFVASPAPWGDALPRVAASSLREAAMQHRLSVVAVVTFVAVVSALVL
ncbi:MAG TPA: hypothetical protein VNS61_12290, partial [Caldimonas sp.]|nr:hypothetical protein [Caldimonas sp.]